MPPPSSTFFRGLSQSALYRRFHGFAQVDEHLVVPLLEPDWDERGVLLGTLAADDGERVVAVANYVRLRDRTRAESAFTVADEHQRRGIGTRLLERLAERAAAVGIERFVAEVLADNRDMLRVFEAVGFELTRELESGEIEVEFPIAPTERYESRVAMRDHTGVTASLRPFFEAESVAVVGASKRRGSIGGELFRNILAGDFTGTAYPVNREGEPVAGVRGYRSLEELPDPVDLAVICLPAAAVNAAAEQALRAGTRALVIISAGFAETGRGGPRPAGRAARPRPRPRRTHDRAELPRHHRRETGLNATFAARGARPGTIGFSSQSGALGVALLEAAEARGLGLSAFVSIGNKADVSTNDLLEWWEDDEATSIVLMYVESFGNPRRFGRLARRVARRKPILALKSGTSAVGRKAASSHTAALAGSEAAVDALFDQAGVIRAASLEELVDVATLLSTQPEPRGRSVAVLTNAGGLGILCADACDAAGLELAQLGDDATKALGALLPAEASVANPVDMLGGATAETYGAALPIAARRSPRRRRDRALRADRRRRRRGGRGRGRGGDRGGGGREAGARGDHERRRHPDPPAVGPAPRRRVLVPRVGRACARPRRRAGRVAAPAAGRAGRARPRRPGGGRGGRRTRARRVRRRLARAGRRTRAAPGLRGTARAGARRGKPGGRGDGRIGAGLPGGRQDRGARRAQDRARRDRARPAGRRGRACRRRADRRAGARAADGEGRRRAARGRRPGSRCSGRSSPSGPAASSPS